ncbi:hypothetical protein KQH65_12640, partial [archaeon]|nr:hypothetical protein [archaeon]
LDLMYGQKNLEEQRKNHDRYSPGYCENSCKDKPIVKFPGPDPVRVVKKEKQKAIKNKRSYAKIWPTMGLKAKQIRIHGAYRVWVLARSLDKLGSGIIAKDDLINALIALDVPGRSIRRYVSQANKSGLFKKQIERQSGTYYLLEGLQGACIILDCKLDRNPVRVDLGDLFGNKWASLLWGAFLVQYNGKQISRSTLEKITGVPESTQRDYEYRGKITVIHNRNYAIAKTKAKYIHGFRENVKKHAFVINTRKNKKGVIAYRLPDAREVPSTIAGVMPKGRTRKVNNALNASLYNDPKQAQGKKIRLFYNDKKAAYNAQKKYSRKNRSLLEEVFLKVRFSPRQFVTTWDVLPLISQSCSDGLLCF